MCRPSSGVPQSHKVIGGAQYKKSSNGQESFAPQIGAQINGVPLVVTHDFETQTTTVGLTFRFGN